MKVSHSKLNSFKSCPQKHYYSYVERIEPITIQKPLYKGSALHELLEIRAKHLIDNNNITWKDHLHQNLQMKYDMLSDNDKDQIGDFIQDAEKILMQYDWVYEDEEIKYLEVEKWIEIPLVKRRNKEDIIFVGKVDAIIEIRGKQYIVEHKTFSSQPMTLQESWINVQTSLYAYALNKYYGYNITGILWDMIKAEPFSEPNILKNGEYGKQSGKVTLMSFKENPGKEVLEQVKNNHLNFLNRFVTPIVQPAIDSFIQESKELAKELDKPADKISKFKRLSKDCSWCPFKDICSTELTGGDVDYVKNMLYRKKEEK